MILRVITLFNDLPIGIHLPILLFFQIEIVEEDNILNLLRLHLIFGDIIIAVVLILAPIIQLREAIARIIHALVKQRLYFVPEQ